MSFPIKMVILRTYVSLPEGIVLNQEYDVALSGVQATMVISQLEYAMTGIQRDILHTSRNMMDL